MEEKPMINWNFNADEYSERNFSLVPEGNHHVIIQNVKERVFNSGNEGFEITYLDVDKYGMINIENLKKAIK